MWVAEMRVGHRDEMRGRDRAGSRRVRSHSEIVEEGRGSAC